ncbi:thioredoxin fold domain-containing protein [Pedobacter petrophilus]|uniref:Thioredoxin fold domain-containing protein n=1 Tax=Pedobacter petrophilus TaxID=1908241 RepID=A0A7K0FZM6_9SPHI|nr:thioredoxin family protein [Pedobacter petrophilus]MRX76429.1 thioredoxin fold domain-containing protein [Pedobacter petrophilus]
MKKVLVLILMATMFIALPAIKSYAVTQDTTATAPPDDVVFTEVGSAQDSAANEIVKDSVKTDTLKTAVSAVTTSKSDADKLTLWQTFIKGLLFGFAAILMPCIFPMLPLTVSFFTKKAGSKSKAVGQAVIYGISIIVIYVALGMLVTIAFGSDALNALSTNGIFNAFFFLMLVVFGASFLGAFEITLPSAFVNKIDAKSDKGGLMGIFFMAFSLALVSFSCTGPLIGTLLVDAASKGDRLGPAVGMFGFSFALAIPFALFALFPSLLKSLPKSGGWLNSVKVVLGFIELAFAFKFLSNVDLAYHWNLLDREIFLAIWIAIFALMGIYLLGKIKFSHDSDLPYLSVPRTFLAIVVFAWVIYLIPGMWGAPLKSISAFLPPTATQDFDLNNLTAAQPAASAKTSIKVKKYAELFHRLTPKGFDPYYDFEQAKQASKELGKPVLIDFTGWNCVNCRKMENNVWSDTEVAKRLKNDFVMAELVVDDKTELPVEEHYVSTFSKKKINTIGKKWSDFQAATFNSNSQPQYVIVDGDGNVLVPPQGADYNPENYIKFLDSGKAAFQNKNK